RAIDGARLASRGPAFRACRVRAARHVAAGRIPPPARPLALRAQRADPRGPAEPGLSVDQRSALALRLSRDQVEIERHQRLRRWELRTIFRRMRLPAERGG